jgi:hypothetical protein
MAKVKKKNSNSDRYTLSSEPFRKMNSLNIILKHSINCGYMLKNVYFWKLYWTIYNVVDFPWLYGHRWLINFISLCSVWIC